MPLRVNSYKYLHPKQAYDFVLFGIPFGRTAQSIEKANRFLESDTKCNYIFTHTNMFLITFF